MLKVNNPTKTIIIHMRPPILNHQHGSQGQSGTHSPADGGMVPEVMQSSTKRIDLSRIFQELNNLGFD